MEFTRWRIREMFGQAYTYTDMRELVSVSYVCMYVRTCVVYTLGGGMLRVRLLVACLPALRTGRLKPELIGLLMAASKLASFLLL